MHKFIIELNFLHEKCVEIDEMKDSEELVDCSNQLTLNFIFGCLYLSVFRDKYQSYKYEKHSREIC